MKRLDKKERCPCGSKKTYGECCWDKDFEFHIDDSGKTIKTIKINDEFREYIDKELQVYQEIFNRDPLPDEPVYLWSLVYSDEDYDDNIEDHLLAEGFDEAFIYAHKKTKLTVTEERLGLFTQDQIDEWEAAILEFSDKKKNPDKYLRKIHKIQYYLEKIEDQIDHLNFQYGLLIFHQNLIVKNLDFKEGLSGDKILNFVLAKNFKTIKAIIELHEKGFNTDCMSLLRSQLENYKSIIGLRYIEEEFININIAKTGIDWGTHEYLRSKTGKLNIKKIRDKNSGQITEMKNGHQIISASPHLEDVLIYEMLQNKFSAFVHTDVSTVHAFLDDSSDGFSHTKRNFKHEVPFYLVYINLLIFLELTNIEYIKDSSKNDLTVWINRVKTLFQDLFQETSKYPETMNIFSEEMASRIS